jgi:hypothetical protein
VDDRSWSAHTSIDPRVASTELVGYTALPAETGPTFAPDRLSIWPVEGGRYGLDAHYHGRTGAERAVVQRRRLAHAGLDAKLLEEQDTALLRLGPLPHEAAWLALEGFLGKPLPNPEP